MKRTVRYTLLMVICFGVIVCLHGSARAETMPEEEKAQVQKITLTDAINLTWANNIELKLLEEQIAARELDLDRAEFYRDKLLNANEKIDDGWKAYNQSRRQLENIINLINAGLVGPGHPAYLTAEEIAEKEAQLANAREKLLAGAQYRIDNLANAQVVELYQTKAALGLEVTRLGVEEARKQYALLTRQKYYEVLKAQRLVEVKKAAVRRAENQYQMAKDSFEAGFRAKDDMLMAQAQLSLLKADLVNGQNTLHQAEIALKQVMGLDQKTLIKLEDDFTVERSITPLETGLEQALTNRVEIKKSEMELEVAKINMELAKRYTTPNTFDFRQIQLDLVNAQWGLEQQKQTVQSEVYGSYQTVLATGEMLDYVQESVKQAQEAVDIAAYRYQEGYGIPSSVLKSLNMEDAGGTIFEVLAAEEKLSEVEEKVVEIVYGYNLAKSKYEVDICADINNTSMVGGVKND